MIKIELQFETGAEARKALEELLGGTTVINTPFVQIPIKDEKIAENFQEPKTENAVEEKPAEEIAATASKRKTKAEKEVEALKKLNAALDPADPEIKDAVQSDIQGEDTKPVSAVTAVMLQNKALDLIRGGKKELVVAVIKKFGGGSISQVDKNPLKEEVYSDVMDELNKL